MSGAAMADDGNYGAAATAATTAATAPKARRGGAKAATAVPVMKRGPTEEQVATMVLRHAGRAVPGAPLAKGTAAVFVPAAAAKKRKRVGDGDDAAVAAAVVVGELERRTYVSWYELPGYPYLIACARFESPAAVVVPLDKQARAAAFGPHAPPDVARRFDVAALPTAADGAPLVDARYVEECRAAAAASAAAAAAASPANGASHEAAPAAAAERVASAAAIPEEPPVAERAPAGPRQRQAPKASVPKGLALAERAPSGPLAAVPEGLAPLAVASVARPPSAYDAAPVVEYVALIGRDAATAARVPFERFGDNADDDDWQTPMARWFATAALPHALFDAPIAAGAVEPGAEPHAFLRRPHDQAQPPLSSTSSSSSAMVQ